MSDELQMTSSDVLSPVCPTEELLKVCTRARNLAAPLRHKSTACARLSHLSSMNTRDRPFDTKGDKDDTCASTKVWLACNPQHVLENTVEISIPPLLFACDANQLSQSADALSSHTPSKCRYVSPMPEAQFARKQQQRAYALTEELRALMKECKADSSDAEEASNIRKILS